jgi:hypothetical protein
MERSSLDSASSELTRLRPVAPIHKEMLMPVQNQKEIFVQLLSGLRPGTERSTKFYQELSQVAEDPEMIDADGCDVHGLSS